MIYSIIHNIMCITLFSYKISFRYQKKMAELAEQLRIEAEFKAQQERIAAELDAEVKRREEEMLAAMAEEERKAYEEEKRKVRMDRSLNV